MKRNYNTVIRALQMGIRPNSADGQHRLELVKADDRWHMMCVMQRYVPNPDTKAYELVGDVHLEYPMSIGQFVDWVDKMSENEYTVLCANVCLNERNKS